MEPGFVRWRYWDWITLSCCGRNCRIPTSYVFPVIADWNDGYGYVVACPLCQTQIQIPAFYLYPATPHEALAGMLTPQSIELCP